MGFLHIEERRFCVHFDDESLVSLFFGKSWQIYSRRGSNFEWFFSLGVFPLKQSFASPNGQSQTGIIPTGQHQSIQQLLDSIDLSLFYVGSSPTDILLKPTNCYTLFEQAKIEFLSNFYHNDTCHDFGEWCDFEGSPWIAGCDYLMTIDQHLPIFHNLINLMLLDAHFSVILYLLGLSFVDDISLSSDILRRNEWLRIVLIQFLFQLQHLPLLFL